LVIVSAAANAFASLVVYNLVILALLMQELPERGGAPALFKCTYFGVSRHSKGGKRLFVDGLYYVVDHLPGMKSVKDRGQEPSSFLPKITM